LVFKQRIFERKYFSAAQEFDPLNQADLSGGDNPVFKKAEPTRVKESNQ
jgi:hypothetical protein